MLVANLDCFEVAFKLLVLIFLVVELLLQRIV